MTREHVYTVLGHGFLLQLSAVILASVGHFLVQNDLAKSALTFLASLSAITSMLIIVWSFVLYLIVFISNLKTVFRGGK